MASATTREFVMTSSRRDASPFSLIEQKGLIARLCEELARATSEASRDPRGFIRDLFSNDTKDAKRRRRIYGGLVVALSAHVALLVFIAYVGLHSAFVKDVEPSYEVNMLNLPSKAHADVPDRAKPEVPRGERGGGGSGGDHNPLPATKGPLPQMSPAPQIVKPSAPSAQMPPLAVSPTIVGPDSARPPVDVALGVPTGARAEAPSPGPGDGGGLGGVDGSGAGSKGGGPGAGGGSGGGKGDKDRAGMPGGINGVPTGPIDWSRLKDYPESTAIAWLRRPTPIIIPEAEANKVTGEVQLRATFQADGTITDVEVVRTVPYMTESAIDSLMRSKFRPATIKGVPVTLRKVLIIIRVKLAGD
jgi:Gram-negative bacterial TonB protein C-terminal